ncbi:glycosyltransferase family 4 protein [Bacteroides sp. 224]|uniref:glycosyltransferase family 4 protein n=1 Tax=Bacteroides sp. 224 TaxID=2302936 RepID=UPI0013CF93CB|nr:glycosyltransferase family 4 protein [Bacteroides sp. 224]NDV63729.1 glycosyltransferase [Bacteroides sp. 224]
MRVLLINTSERTGGAAVAAGRLLEALKNNGIKAKMLVRDKQTDRISVIALDKSKMQLWYFLWERVVIWAANRFKRHNLFEVDIANAGKDITSLPEFKEADIIHLHWINQGMLSLKGIRKILKSGKPVVWTMHDMWPCTGICHYAGECTEYQNSCGHCSYLINGGYKKDLSYRRFLKKQKMLQGSSISFVACSRWLEEQAKKSALLIDQSVCNIPNPINTNLFKPRNKQEARSKCNLPTDKSLILFGSVKIKDKRKGAKYLAEACEILIKKYPELKDNLGVVVLGHQSKYLEKYIPFKVYSMDYVSNEHKLVDIYNSVDMYVTPSLEDNLPNTIMEAMACGVPCVGFNVGGIPEMIDHLHNGYVAKYKSAEDFANGIYWILSEGNYPVLSEQASRKVVSSYSERIIAKKYIDIYNKLTGSHA